MTQTALVDTNILVYAYDKRNPEKQARAAQVLMRLRDASAGYLSVKTLSEFFVAIRRIPNPLTIDEALSEIEKYVRSWPVFDLTPSIVIEAARGVRDYQFSYWDAQMWATAKAHRLQAVFSEDMRSGSVIEGIAIVNPRWIRLTSIPG